MNTYLLPICYPDILPVIITVVAPSLGDAQDKFMNKVCNHLDIDNVYDDWTSFVHDMCDHDCYVGEIYDKDQF